MIHIQVEEARRLKARSIQFKEDYFGTHYNQNVKRQTQRENFKSGKREMTHHIQGKLHMFINRFVCGNLVGQGRMERYIQSAKREKKNPTN